MADRVPFARHLARMQAVGFRPSSIRGQNFLLDPSLHRFLCERAEATAEDTIVEIGVGLGFLTRELAGVAGRVVGLEIDERLLELAREELRDCPNVELVHADALGGPGRSLCPEIESALADGESGGGRGLLVANLPYSVSGPLLAEMTALRRLPARAILLVQKELAQRLAARPGGKDYGGLSVLVQALFRARRLRDVSPEVFRPRPKVTSSVLVLERRDDLPMALGGPEARREFGQFVRALFQQRRKALRTTLARAWTAIGREAPAALPRELGASRAEAHPPDEVLGWWMGRIP